MSKKSTVTKKKRFKILRLSKRRKLVLVAIILSLGLLGVQNFFDLYRYIAIGVFGLLAMLLTWWALWEDLKKVSWLMVIILPVSFVVAISLFYFLLPEKFLTRIILFSLFAIGMYAVLLTVNIFTVSTVRTIQLLRAAQALGFVLSLVIAFLMFDTILSFKWDPWINAGIIFGVSFPLVLQGVWCMVLQDNITEEIAAYSFALAFCLAQAGFIISLWPVSIIIASLFLVSIFYVGLGLIQQAMIGRLFRKTIREYVRVGLIVLIVVIVTASFGGN
jgi:uncharacterized protein DUF5656